MLVAQPGLAVALHVGRGASAWALQVTIRTRVEVAEVGHVESMSSSRLLIQLHDRRLETLTLDVAGGAVGTEAARLGQTGRGNVAAAILLLVFLAGEGDAGADCVALALSTHALLAADTAHLRPQCHLAVL